MRVYRMHKFVMHITILQIFMMHIAMILDNDDGTYMFVACIYDELNFKYKAFIFIFNMSHNRCQRLEYTLYRVVIVYA